MKAKKHSRSIYLYTGKKNKYEIYKDESHNCWKLVCNEFGQEGYFTETYETKYDAVQDMEQFEDEEG
jgi:hypothetical protein